MIKAIYFDWGQVFLKESINKESKLNKFLERNGLNKKKFKDLWNKFYILRSAGKIGSDYEMGLYMSTILKKAVPLKEILEIKANNQFVPNEYITIAKKLKENYKIGILSNGVKEWIFKTMKRYKIRNLFDAIIVSSAVGVRKPNPLIYYEAARKMRVEPKEILFVSDEIADDLVTASGLGFNTVWLNLGVKAELKGIDDKVLNIYKPDFTIKNLKEVISVVQKV